MKPIYTACKGNQRLEIYVDEFPSDPRKEFGNLGTIVSFSASGFGDLQGDLGEDRMQSLAIDAHESYAARHEAMTRLLESAGLEEGEEAFDEAVAKLTLQALGECAAVPLRVLESSGQLWVSETQWGERFDAVMYVPWNKAETEWGTGEEARQKHISILRAELDTYVQWCNGEVYGFRLVEVDEDEEEGAGIPNASASTTI